MERIILTGNPLSTQHIYGQTGNRRYMKKAAKERKEQYQWEAKSQWKHQPIKGAVGLDIIFYFGDRRKRDVLDNYHKLAADALEGIVYEDDSQIENATIHKSYDKENPRIEILIEAD